MNLGVVIFVSCLTLLALYVHFVRYRSIYTYVVGDISFLHLPPIESGVSGIREAPRRREGQLLLDHRGYRCCSCDGQPNKILITNTDGTGVRLMILRYSTQTNKYRTITESCHTKTRGANSLFRESSKIQLAFTIMDSTWHQERQK